MSRVRERGVMEKCTYCVQRIAEARIGADIADTPIADGAVMTACQQACPTRAISFGNIKDKTAPRRRREGRAHQLRHAGRARHPAAHHLPRARSATVSDENGWRVLRTRQIAGRIASVPLSGRLPRWFWLGFAVCFLVGLGFLFSVTWLLVEGIGTLGLNIPAAWGFMIVNTVWWIGIGHAGTLISAVLILLNQNWRASINRFAEAMTLLAAGMAGLFPILHLGRPEYFYWLLPLPVTHMPWPQWRSPLVWDFFAIATYIIVSLLFWYMGLVPDLAVLRDRATDARQADRLRHTGARLAWIGVPLVALRDGLFPDRRTGDAAGRFGALGGLARFHRRHHPRLSLDDLPALFRRRRALFRLCHGADDRDAAAHVLRLQGLHHRQAPRQRRAR